MGAAILLLELPSSFIRPFFPKSTCVRFRCKGHTAWYISNWTFYKTNSSRNSFKVSAYMAPEQGLFSAMWGSAVLITELRVWFDWYFFQNVETLCQIKRRSTWCLFACTSCCWQETWVRFQQQAALGNFTITSAIIIVKIILWSIDPFQAKNGLSGEVFGICGKFKESSQKVLDGHRQQKLQTKMICDIYR